MKIQIDKVASPPLHSLTAMKLKAALSLLPSEWTDSLSLVRMSNQLPPKGLGERPVVLTHLLKICDRGVPEMEIVREIYLELAQRNAPHDGKLRAHYANRLDPQQLKFLYEMIQPYVDKYDELRFLEG